MTGLTMGKFMPFHLGHIKLIEFALDQVDELIVLVVSKDGEEIPGSIRMEWLTDYYRNEPRIKIILFHHQLPHDGDFTEEKMNQWCRAIGALVPAVDMVIASEPYGLYLASFLGADCRMFDQERQLVCISGTEIRKDPLRCFDFLPHMVQIYYLEELKKHGES